MSKKIPAPSSCLPPLKRLSAFDAAQVSTFLGHLREIYQPEVNGYRNASPTKAAHDSGYASEASDDDEDDCRSTSSSASSIDVLRTDRFERSIAMKWLTGLVSHGEEWIEEGLSGEEQNERIRATEDAAALLAACSGTTTGPLMRTFDFLRSSHLEDNEDRIVIHIRDASILSQDHTSVGLQTWGSSCILAQKMVQSPAAFGLQQRSSGEELRILELGAGTGVLSMVMAKLFTSDEAQVVATDYHPAVLDNLRANVSGNFEGALSSSSHQAPTILPLDWRHLHCIASTCAISDAKQEAPFDTPFDVILGADIIYEPEHALWIKSSVELLLKRDLNSFFYLIMPKRPTHEAETASVPETFPMAADVRKNGCSGDEGKTLKQIAILDISEIDRIVGTGRVDEIQYLLYRIGWV
ncbi:hypothetical protein FRC04_004549 [Tulasnella sp. 424]|nr:hypothetical protein FRC04_004549 [Tulasnella sp. 424]KAG8976617.1 hypothetical protein FRC05_003456 [Tulasnella sp. 425]